MRLYELDIVPSEIKRVIRLSEKDNNQPIGFVLKDGGEYYDPSSEYTEYVIELSDSVTSSLTLNNDPAGRYKYLQIASEGILTAAAGKFLATIRLRQSDYEEGDLQIRIPLFLEIEEEPQ